MADLLDWLYSTLKNSDLGKRADENWNKRQSGQLGPAVSIPGVDWAAIDASRKPQPPAALTPRLVNTVPVDNYGNPAIPSLSAQLARTEQRSGVRPAITQGVQPAGTVQMPPGARPASVDRAFAQMNGIQPSGGGSRGRTVQSAVWDPFGTSSVAKDESRMMPSDPRMAFAGDTQNPAVAAIDMLTGSGNSVLPRPLPLALMRSPLAQSSQPSGGDYTIKKGDTLSALAKRYNTTVNNLAMANGIKDPNKIRAGASLIIPGPPQPRQKPAGMLAAAPAQQSRTDRFTNLDRFGMIK